MPKAYKGPEKPYLAEIRRHEPNAKPGQKYFSGNQRFKKIGQGRQGNVFYDTKRDRVIKIIFEDKGTSRQNSKLVYLVHKIAGLLFPGQILQYHIAARPVETPTGRYLSFLTSDRVNVSSEHQMYERYRDLRAPHMYEQYEDLADEMLLPHLNNLEKFGYKRFVSELNSYGLLADSAEQNFDVVRGKIFAFEVYNLIPYRLESKLNEIEKTRGKRVRERIESYLNAFKDPERRARLFNRE